MNWSPTPCSAAQSVGTAPLLSNARHSSVSANLPIPSRFTAGVAGLFLILSQLSERPGKRDAPTESYQKVSPRRKAGALAWGSREGMRGNREERFSRLNRARDAGEIHHCCDLKLSLKATTA